MPRPPITKTPSAKDTSANIGFEAKLRDIYRCIPTDHEIARTERQSSECFPSTFTAYSNLSGKGEIRRKLIEADGKRLCHLPSMFTTD